VPGLGKLSFFLYSDIPLKMELKLHGVIIGIVVVVETLSPKPAILCTLKEWPRVIFRKGLNQENGTENYR
jgi:hypothetical protein